MLPIHERGWLQRSPFSAIKSVSSGCLRPVFLGLFGQDLKGFLEQEAMVT